MSKPKKGNEERRTGTGSEVRAFRADDGSPKIEGYAAVFGKYSENLGGFVEKIKPGAFTDALKKSDARALFNHDPNIILGRESAGTLSLKQDDRGLFMSVDPPKTQRAEEIMAGIQRGDITQQSFGFTVAEDSWRRSEKYGEIRTIEKIGTLYDVSPVTFPAYPDTKVALRSRESWLKSEDTEKGLCIDVDGTEWRFTSYDEFWALLREIMKGEDIAQVTYDFESGNFVVTNRDMISDDTDPKVESREEYEDNPKIEPVLATDKDVKALLKRIGGY